jgi:hypothetical protein
LDVEHRLDKVDTFGDAASEKRARTAVSSRRCRIASATASVSLPSVSLFAAFSMSAATSSQGTPVQFRVPEPACVLRVTRIPQ